MSARTFSLKIKASAVKALKRVPRSDRLRLIVGIDSLKTQPLRGQLLKGDLSGLRRLRVGRDRVIYEVREDEPIVLVVKIGHRRDIYRR